MCKIIFGYSTQYLHKQHKTINEEKQWDASSNNTKEFYKKGIKF